MKRNSYYLDDEEIGKFIRLTCQHPKDGEAYAFWRGVAYDRGLDYQTILGIEGRPHEFTALPLGHGKHWCWSLTLKCRHAPPKFIEGVM